MSTISSGLQLFVAMPRSDDMDSRPHDGAESTTEPVHSVAMHSLGPFYEPNGELDEVFSKERTRDPQESLEKEGSESPVASSSKRMRTKEPAAETEMAEFEESGISVGTFIEGILGKDGKIGWESKKGSFPLANLRAIEEMVRKISEKFTGKSRGIQILVSQENPNWDKFVEAMECFHKKFFCNRESYKSSDSDLRSLEKARALKRLRYLRKVEGAGFLIDFVGTHEYWPRTSEKMQEIGNKMRKAATAEAEVEEIRAPVGTFIKGILGKDGKIGWELKKGSFPLANLRAIEEMVQKISKKFTGGSRGIQILVSRENPDWRKFVRAIGSFRRFFCDRESYRVWNINSRSLNRNNYLDAIEKTGFLIDFVGTHEYWPRTPEKMQEIGNKMRKAATAEAEVEEIRAPVGTFIKGILGKDGKIGWETKKGSFPLANLRAIEEMVREISEKLTGKSRGIQILVSRENPDWGKFVKAIGSFCKFFCNRESYRVWNEKSCSSNRGNYLDAVEESGFFIDFIGTHNDWVRTKSCRMKRIAEQMQASAKTTAKKENLTAKQALQLAH